MDFFFLTKGTMQESLGVQGSGKYGLFGDVERDILDGVDEDNAVERSQNHEVVGTWV